MPQPSSVHCSGVSCIDAVFCMSKFSGNNSCKLQCGTWHMCKVCIMLPTFLPIAPGPVSKLSYEENTDTSVTITWKPPKEPNGDLVAYFVEHGVYQNESTRSVAMDARRPTRTAIQALGNLLLLYIVLTLINQQVCVLSQNDGSHQTVAFNYMCKCCNISVCSQMTGIVPEE